METNQAVRGGTEMNPLTPLELLDIIEREHGFESPSIRLALERAKKVEELLTYQNHYIDCIVIELDRITNKVKGSQIEIIKKELEELK